MQSQQLNWITNFIWGIADDVLRDLYVRGKYRDIILPMTIIRRLDAVLEPNKQAVIDTTSTNSNLCAAWMKSGRICWPSSRRRQGWWRKSSREGAKPRRETIDLAWLPDEA